MTVVTRFAPSPTGYLHVGGARTALFNWLLARRAGGKFILRIEDTDQARSSKESLAKIIQDLRWLGLDWDEGPDRDGPNGPYFQSQRLEIYRHYVDKLLEMGRAYKCFETPDQLAAARKEASKSGGNYKYNRAGRDLTEQQIKQYEDQGQPCTIRFAMPDRAITVNDMVLGNVTVQPQQLDDFIILKSDGFPTFHLAVVVDDKLMGITHILRGQEHLINTPKHIALQEALGFDRPAYAHMPLIFNMDGSKMSKRDKEKAIKKGLPVPEIDVHDFRAGGYLPEALLNFIALLGWSPGQNRELMTLGEMTELFSIDRIGKTNAKFDRDKLQAFNADYIKSASDQRLLEAVRQFPELDQYPLKGADDQMLLKLFPLYRPRAKTLRELAQASSLFFVDKVTYDPKAVKKVLRKGQGAEVLALAAEQLPKLQQWTVAEIQKCIEDICGQLNVNLGKVAQPLRVAATGGTVSPPIFETLELLGRQRTVDRLGQALQMLSDTTETE